MRIALMLFILVMAVIPALDPSRSMFAAFSTRHAQDDAQSIRFTEYRVRETGGTVGDITLGPDGNLWFTHTAGRIGRITPKGQIKMFHLPENVHPWRLTSSLDGNLWFTSRSAVGRFALTGETTAFPVPDSISDVDVWDITTGADGNLWATGHDANVIWRITPEGHIKTFPNPAKKGTPWGIASGADGNIWFTDVDADTIVRMTPEGITAEFTPPHRYVWDITDGPDGNMWFTQGPWRTIGRITPDGVITEFNLWNAWEGAGGITAGPDHNLWFTGKASKDFVGRITQNGVVTQYYLPASITWPNEITSGPDGNVWFTAQGDTHRDQKIVRVSRDYGPLAPVPGMPKSGKLTIVWPIMGVTCLALILCGVAIRRSTLCSQSQQP